MVTLYLLVFIAPQTCQHTVSNPKGPDDLIAVSRKSSYTGVLGDTTTQLYLVLPSITPAPTFNGQPRIVTPGNWPH